jgi:hypothetical protein
MPKFDDLIKEDFVKSHPLLQGYRNLPEIREAMLKHAQEMQEEAINPNDLEDMFSKPKGYQEPESNDIRSVVHEASSVLQDVLCQFDIPLFPKVRFVNTRDVKYASHNPSQVVDGLVIFTADFTSLTGIRKQATIPISVCEGMVVPPSVMEIDGRMYVIAQSSINEIINRNTMYQLPQLREQYDPPMTRVEREMAVGMRNNEGWQPRRNDGNFMMCRKDSAKSTPVAYNAVVKDMIEAEEKGEDTFPRSFMYLMRNYILNHVSTCSKDKWIIPLMNDGFCLNPYGVNRGRYRKMSAVEEVEEEGKEQEADESEGMEDKEMEFDVDSDDIMYGSDVVKRDQMFYPETKTPIEPGDRVRFDSPDGVIRVTVVDTDPDQSKIIVKSKGYEYRVDLEKIEPVPSTFQKMYK